MAAVQTSSTQLSLLNVEEACCEGELSEAIESDLKLSEGEDFNKELQLVYMHEDGEHLLIGMSTVHKAEKRHFFSGQDDRQMCEL